MHIVFLGAIATVLVVIVLLISNRNQDIALIASHCRELGVERSRPAIAAAIDGNFAYRCCWLFILTAVVTGNLGSAAYVLGRPHAMIACLALTLLFAIGGLTAMAIGCRKVMRACAEGSPASLAGSDAAIQPNSG